MTYLQTPIRAKRKQQALHLNTKISQKIEKPPPDRQAEKRKQHNAYSPQQPTTSKKRTKNTHGHAGVEPN